MRKRGRKSSASLAVTTAVQSIPRPDAPYDLTDEQSQEWWAVVNRLPADWFPRETHGMLTQYCRHVVASRRIAQLIANCEKADDFDLDKYEQLLKMQEREGRAISSLATRMRISQQSTVRHREATKPDMQGNPWEFEG